MVCTLGAKSDTQAESALRGFRSAVRARQANASDRTQQNLKRRKSFEKALVSDLTGKGDGSGVFGRAFKRMWEW